MLAKRKSVPPRKICKGVKFMDRYRHKEQKVRFTEDEFNYVLSKMADSGKKNFQHFALDMLIQGEVSFVDYTELRRLVYEVKKIGTNINQVVRLANQFDDISETDVRDLTKALTKLTELVESELHIQQDKFKRKKVD